MIKIKMTKPIGMYIPIPSHRYRRISVANAAFRLFSWSLSKLRPGRGGAWEKLSGAETGKIYQRGYRHL